MIPSWVKILYWNILLTITAAESETNIHPKNPILNIEMTDAGFHRTLTYNVHFDYPNQTDKECRYVLQQRLPASVYINPDELDDLVRLKKLNAIYPKDINVETVTEQSDPFFVLLWASATISEKIVLPIHFRYHYPRYNTSFVKVEIDKPEMFIQCHNHPEPYESSNNKYFCPKGGKMVEESKTNKCYPCSESKLIGYDLVNEHRQIAYIPVDNINTKNPILNIEMTDAGFHRTLTYNVHFDYPDQTDKECRYILQQRLPASVYINPDELDDLVRLKKLNAIYPKDINVETVTEKSRPIFLLLWASATISEKIVLPIHFRYHYPRNNTSFVKVEIDIPEMFIQCHNHPELYESSNNKYFCPKGGKMVEDSKTNKCYPCSICKLIGYDLVNEHRQIAYIPVGNVANSKFVLYGTIVISWLGCICIIYTIHSKFENLKEKQN